jgi:hypothetical protein
MNARFFNCTLLAIAAWMALLPVSAQTPLTGEAGIRPSIKSASSAPNTRVAASPLALPWSADGPADPTDPSRPLMCNRDVQKQFREAFMKTRNGEERMGLAEAGRSIQLEQGALSFGPWVTSAINDGQAGERPNSMSLRKDGYSIAVFHTHGNNARAVPSAADLSGDLPNFVVSRFAVYVTIPGARAYLRLDPSACR